MDQGTFPNAGAGECVLAYLIHATQRGRPAGDVRREHAGSGEGMDVVPVLRTIRSVAPHNVEDGQRIEIARMQQLLAERD
jgi:hypothetical protein